MHHEGNLVIWNAEDARRYRDVTSVGGYLFIDAQVALPALASVVGGLEIHAKADLPALTSVGGYLFIDAQVALPALASVVGGLEIHAKADLPALTSVGGYPLPDPATAEANLRKIAPLALKEGALEMDDWHCGTAHCIAGWGQFAILGKTDNSTASIDGTRVLGLEATKHFHVSNEEAREFLKQYT